MSEKELHDALMKVHGKFVECYTNMGWEACEAIRLAYKSVKPVSDVIAEQYRYVRKLEREVRRRRCGGNRRSAAESTVCGPKPAL